MLVRHSRALLAAGGSGKTASGVGESRLRGHATRRLKSHMSSEVNTALPYLVIGCSAKAAKQAA